MATKATKAAKATPTRKAPSRPVAAPSDGRADKSALLARRHDTTTGFPEEDVEIEGFGTVRVRGLSRHEALHMRSGNAKTPLMVERLTIAAGIIDPVMSEADVERWQKVAPAGELDAVTEAIGRLSGMFDKAIKKAYNEFEDDPGSEFRLLPGEGATDDGSPSTD